MTQYIVIAGNPMDGFIYLGPFPSEAEAVAYVESDDFTEREYWVTDLYAALRCRRCDRWIHPLGEGHWGDSDDFTHCSDDQPHTPSDLPTVGTP